MHVSAARILAEELAHPRHAFAPDDMIGVDHPFDSRDRGDVAADHDRRPRRMETHQAAHLPHLADVDDDRGDADDVVVV